MRAVILTASTSGYAGKREDLSGPEVRRLVEDAGIEVVSMKILPDDRELLEREMCEVADTHTAELLLTTGGTGFSRTDCTPEATMAVCERNVPGIPEAMRMASMQYTKRAMLSRAAAGIRRETLIVNLPGSPKAVRECLEYILPEVIHGVEIMTGEASECGRK